MLGAPDMGVVSQLERHCQVVTRRLTEGKVIPFLGAGANLCERPAESNWLSDGYLPSGRELARYFADNYAYPEEEDDDDLLRVSQYVELTAGDAVLFEELRSIFVRTYEPNKLHRLLAHLPADMPKDGERGRGQLIITTNYDDALERAFAEAGEEFDVVAYIAAPDEPGRFVHIRPDGERVPIPKHTDYRAFALDERSVILKIHGAVDRSDAQSDSYVITEDQYIDYLARESATRLIPAMLMARMRSSHFLFLGYGMRDWNLRVILRSIWAEQMRHFASWAIQRDPSEIDLRFWERHRVEILKVTLEEWVDAMSAQLE
jgi:SIR2-like domain